MSVRRAVPLNVTFPAVDVTNPPYSLTGLVLTGTDVKISKDGGSFAGVANSITEIDSTGVYTVQLSAAEMDASWLHLKLERALVQPFHLTIGTYGGKTGTILASGGNTASSFKTDMAESPDDYWKDALLVFTTGSLAGQVKKISAYDAATGIVILTTAFTGAPSASDRFSLLNI